MTIKKTTTYTTEDGKVFTSQADALKHQSELDKLNYKVLYYELKKELEDLKRKYEVLAPWGKFGEREPIGMLNGEQKPIYMSETKN